MKTYKARVIMKGKSYKQFIEGIDFLDDNKYYMLIFHAESLRDFFRFYWEIFRKHKLIYH